MKIRAAIIGPTGYTGLYLMQLLRRHPEAEVTYLASHRDELPDIRNEFPQLQGIVPAAVAVCRKIDPDQIASEADVVFLALPHRVAMEHVPPLLDAGLRVIDLSADYRMKDPAAYEAAYKHPHTDTANLAEAVYGLPELHRDELPGAMLIANPGCYPTAAVLSISPLLSNRLARPEGIVINATSGVTGAGRSPAPHLHFPEQNEAFGAYGEIGQHRHGVEINQLLGQVNGGAVHALFVPHLLPIDRGILETIYLDPVDDDVTEEDVIEALNEAYADEPFVRVRKSLPNVKHVRDTNFCDVAVRCCEFGEQTKIVVFSAIDNMIKGASGQAIQNMNAVFERDETLGLL